MSVLQINYSDGVTRRSIETEQDNACFNYAPALLAALFSWLVDAGLLKVCRVRTHSLYGLFGVITMYMDV